MRLDGSYDRAFIHFRDRFMMVPRKTMEQELKAQEKELTDDINNLNKKVGCSVVVQALRSPRDMSGKIS